MDKFTGQGAALISVDETLCSHIFMPFSRYASGAPPRIMLRYFIRHFTLLECVLFAAGKSLAASQSKAHARIQTMPPFGQQ